MSCAFSDTVLTKMVTGPVIVFTDFNDDHVIVQWLSAIVESKDLHIITDDGLAESYRETSTLRS